MQSRSSTWKALADTGSYLLNATAVIGGVEYTSTSAPVINRGLFSDTPSVGNCTSASLNFSILTDSEIEKSAEVVIKQKLLESLGGTESEELPAGTFYITNRAKDYSSSLLTLQCYDAMLKAQQNFFSSDDEIDDTQWPQPMANVVTTIASRIGVDVDSRTTIRTESYYAVGCPEGKTLMDVLGYIGAVHGGNWIITPAGKLRLVPLITAPTDDTDDAVNVTAVLSQLTTGRQLVVSGVTMADADGNSYTAGDDSEFVIAITDNPYVSQEICDDLYKSMAGLVYNPFTMTKAIYDPAAELGDPVLYNGLVYSFIAKEDATLNVAFQSTISAPSNTELEDEYPYQSSSDKEIDALKDSVSNLSEANGIVSIVNYYLVTSLSTGVTVDTAATVTYTDESGNTLTDEDGNALIGSVSSWTTEVQTMTAEDRYLWNYTVTTYTDGSTSTTDPCIIGVYGDTGNDGADGVGISNVIDYYALSTSSSEVTGKWGTEPLTMTVDQRYLWNYEVIVYTDGTTKSTDQRVIGVYGDTGEQGIQGLQGEQGERGIQGESGADGKTSYFHIKYSDVANPTTADEMTETPSTYIGTYVDYTEEDSTDPADYTWSKWQGSDGADGIAGTNGEDGKTYYLHIAYATSADGTEGFSTTDSTDKTYIGQYTDTTEADSEKPSDYSWTLIKGADGADGADGKGIETTETSYQVSASGTTPPTGTWLDSVPVVSDGQYLWTRTIFVYTDNSVNTIYTVSKAGETGSTGNGISSITNYYLATSAASNVSTDTSGWTDSIQEMTATNKYLWNYEVISYTNGSTATTTPCIIGVYGDDGEDGADGVGISGITEYYAVSSSNSKAPTEWQTDVPEMTSTNKYLWNYEVITYTNSTTYTSDKRVIGVYGDAGSDGRGITSTTITYQVSTSGTSTPTGTWSGTVPEVAQGSYLWTRTVFTYSDGTSETMYSVSYYGADGANGTDGDDGTGIVSITNYYLATSAASGVKTDTSGWTTTVQLVSAENRYLWNYEVVTLTDGNSDITEPCIIGVYGEDGVGIAEVVEYYAVSSSSSTAPTSWSTSVQTMNQSEKYLWNYEEIIYTDENTSTTEPCVIGVYGDTGTDGISLSVESDSGFVITGTSTADVTLTARIYSGSEELDPDGAFTYIWYGKIDEDSEFSVIATGKVITLSASAFETIAQVYFTADPGESTETYYLLDENGNALTDESGNYLTYLTA